jgi:hypothetical protein
MLSGGSIFDEARRMSQAKRSSPSNSVLKKDRNQVPAVSSHRVQSNLPLSDDIKSMMNKMKELHDDIDHQLDEAYQKSGWSSVEIKQFLDNPNNFDSKEWQRVQSERNALLSTIWDKIKGEQDNPFITAPEVPKQQNPTNRERKAKMGAARRNWISMR